MTTTTSISMKLLLLPLLIFFATVYFHINLSNLKTSLSAHFYVPSHNAQAESTFLLPDAAFTGYIISTDEVRYNHCKAVFIKLGITSHRLTPFAYNSSVIHNAMLQLYHSSNNSIESKNPGGITSRKVRKFLSIRLPFATLLQEFLNDPVAELASWRFFMDNDIALYPFLTPSLAREVLSRVWKWQQEMGWCTWA